MKLMNDNKELRRNWRRNWLGSIQEFADLATQRRLWLDPNVSNPHYSFVEYMCCYFLGIIFLDYGYAEAREQGFVTADEAAAVEPFHAILDAYEAPGKNDYDHQAILAGPKWEEVVAAAKSAQSALLKLIHDPEERHELLEISTYALQAGVKNQRPLSTNLRRSLGLNERQLSGSDSGRPIGKSLGLKSVLSLQPFESLTRDCDTPQGAEKRGWGGGVTTDRL